MLRKYLRKDCNWPMSLLFQNSALQRLCESFHHFVLRQSIHFSELKKKVPQPRETTSIFRFGFVLNYANKANIHSLIIAHKTTEDRTHAGIIFGEGEDAQKWDGGFGGRFLKVLAGPWQALVWENIKPPPHPILKLRSRVFNNSIWKQYMKGKHDEVVNFWNLKRRRGV